MKLKTYNVYKAGSDKIDAITASCITKACKDFIATLDQDAIYSLDSKECGRVQLTCNAWRAWSDYIIQEA